MSMVDATIAVCTLNRAEKLHRLLESFCGLRIPDRTSLEILVVDNASTDQTPAVLQRFTAKLPLRVCVEHRNGHTCARNRVLKEMRGRILLCTDDDCTVPVDWLATYLDAWHKFPLASFYAGSIVPQMPEFSEHVRTHLLTETPSCFAAFTVGPDDIRVDVRSPIEHIPFGANFAMQRNAALSQTFDEKLGRRHGKHVLGGEEIRFLWQLMTKGASGWLIANNHVDHWQEAERVTPRFISDYYHGVGLQWLPPPSGRWETSRLRKHFLKSKISFLIACATTRGNPALFVPALRDASMQLGSIESSTIDPQQRMVDGNGKLV